MAISNFDFDNNRRCKRAEHELCSVEDIVTIRNLGIEQEIDLPVRNGALPKITAVYTTTLRNGTKVREVGFDALARALAVIKADADQEFLEARVELDRQQAREKASEIEALLDDYLVKKKLLASQSEALQRRALDWIIERSMDGAGKPIGLFRRSRIVITTLYIGAGGGTSSLYKDGEEVASESTTADLLNYIQERLLPTDGTFQP